MATGAAAVLLVEDDESLRLVTRLACERAGFIVREATTGADALLEAATHRPDIVLLDLMLPDMSGYDVCRAIRRRDARLPIMMVTARGEESDKVVGLELGADDYLTKPFGTRELVARIRVQLRKAAQVAGSAAPAHATSTPLSAANGAPSAPTAAVSGTDGVTPANQPTLHLGPLTILPEEREVQIAGAALTLTRTEFDLLHYLAQNTGKALSRAQIIAAVWGYDASGDDRLVDSHIKNLRKKLDRCGLDRPQIATVPQIGYKLVRE